MSLYHCEGCEQKFSYSNMAFGSRRKNHSHCKPCQKKYDDALDASAREDGLMIHNYWKEQDAIQAYRRSQVIEIPHSGRDEDSEAFRNVRF